MTLLKEQSQKPLRITKMLCASCEHFYFGRPPKCFAFPDGIPMKIFSGEEDHSKPITEQEGDFVFKRRK